MDEAMTDTVVDTIERIASMTQEEVDDLPYGFVVLDEAGTILLYNRYEARMSRIPPERVIGRGFFTEVAPCTRVDAFQGRFRALLADPARQADSFAFRFHFLHGAQDVIIRLTRVPAGATGPLAGARVLMTVERRRVLVEGEAPVSLSLDLTRGRATSPLGAVFPLGGSLLSSVLLRLGPEAAREVGRSMGASIAALAEAEARDAGAPGLDGAPVLLAAGTLDDALARSGLGRLALDLTPRVDRGIIGCLVRPPVSIASISFVALYEGLLEAALGAALGERLTARCLEEGDSLAVPWRFALASAGSAAVLVPAAGERARDVARRIGLLEDDDP